MESPGGYIPVGGDLISVITVQAIGRAEPDKTAVVLHDLEDILLGNAIRSRQMLEPDSCRRDGCRRGGGFDFRGQRFIQQDSDNQETSHPSFLSDKYPL
jgi:hypothetical protein